MHHAVIVGPIPQHLPWGDEVLPYADGRHRAEELLAPGAISVIDFGKIRQFWKMSRVALIY